MRTGTAGFSQPPFGLGSFTALKLTNISAPQGVRGPQGFNFSAAGVSAAQEKVERDKWKAALEFYNETGVMDISYDGFFKQNDLDTVTKLVTYAQPDYFSEYSAGQYTRVQLCHDYLYSAAVPLLPQPEAPARGGC